MKHVLAIVLFSAYTLLAGVSVVAYVDGGSELNMFYEMDDGKKALLFGKNDSGIVVSEEERKDFPPGVSLQAGETYPDAYEARVRRMVFRYVGTGSAAGSDPLGGVLSETSDVKAFPFRPGVFVFASDTIPPSRGFLYSPEVRKLLTFNPVLSMEPKAGGAYDKETIRVYLKFLSALSPRSFGFYYDGDSTLYDAYVKRLSEIRTWIESNVPEKERAEFYYGKLDLASSVVASAKKIWDAYSSASSLFPDSYVNPLSFDNSAQAITGAGADLDPYMRISPGGELEVAEDESSYPGPAGFSSVSYRKATLADVRRKIGLDRKRLSEIVGDSIVSKLNDAPPEEYAIPGADEMKVVAVTGFAYPRVNALFEGNESNQTETSGMIEDFFRGAQYMENVTMVQWKPGSPFVKTVSATGVRGFVMKLEPKSAGEESVVANGGSSSSGGGDETVPELNATAAYPDVNESEYDFVVAYAYVKGTDSIYGNAPGTVDAVKNDCGANFSEENSVLFYKANDEGVPVGFIKKIIVDEPEALLITKSLSWMSKKKGEDENESGYGVFPGDVKRVYDILLSESGVNLKQGGKIRAKVYVSYMFDAREVWKRAPGGSYYVRVADPSERVKAYLQYLSDCDFGDCAVESSEEIFPDYYLTAKTMIPLKGRVILRHSADGLLYGCPSPSGACDSMSLHFKNVTTESLIYLSSEPETAVVVYDLPEYVPGTPPSGIISNMKILGPLGYGQPLYGLPVLGIGFSSSYQFSDVTDSSGAVDWKLVFMKTAGLYGIQQSALGSVEEVPGYPHSLTCDLYPRTQSDEDACYASYIVGGESYSVYDYLYSRSGNFTVSGKLMYDGPGSEFAIRNDYFHADVCTNTYFYLRSLSLGCQDSSLQEATDDCGRQIMDYYKGVYRDVPGYFAADQNEVCQ